MLEYIKKILGMGESAPKEKAIPYSELSDEVRKEMKSRVRKQKYN
jgi:hypothetical protein